MPTPSIQVKICSSSIFKKEKKKKKKNQSHLKQEKENLAVGEQQRYRIAFHSQIQLISLGPAWRFNIYGNLIIIVEKFSILTKCIRQHILISAVVNFLGEKNIYIKRQHHCSRTSRKQAHAHLIYWA
jgi:hypothetical protein